MTTRRGFRYDRGSSRLEVIVDGVVAARFDNISPSLALTTPLAVGSGGTGVATLADHYVLTGSGTGAVTLITPSTSGYVLTSNGASSDPSFQVASTGHSLALSIALGG